MIKFPTDCGIGELRGDQVATRECYIVMLEMEDHQQTMCIEEQWGLDIMGPFPTAVRQLKFLVVGIDYFTKWVEVEVLATITKKNIRSFVWRNIICKYEIPKVLVSENGKQFDNNAFRDFCSELGIKNHYSSPAHL